MNYLYKITNIINGKLYIGQTKNPRRRWNKHKEMSLKPIQIISLAIQKYGFDNFTYEVIASCKTLDDANQLEIELIKQYDSYVSYDKGYNCTHGGKNALLSEESRLKISKANTGKKRTLEAIEKIRAATFRQYATNGSPRLGKTHSEEAKKKMSFAKQGKKRPHSEETKKRMSEARKVYLINKET